MLGTWKTKLLLLQLPLLLSTSEVVIINVHLVWLYNLLSLSLMIPSHTAFMQKVLKYWICYTCMPSEAYDTKYCLIRVKHFHLVIHPCDNDVYMHICIYIQFSYKSVTCIYIQFSYKSVRLPADGYRHVKHVPDTAVTQRQSLIHKTINFDTGQHKKITIQLWTVSSVKGSGTTATTGSTLFSTE